jgi:hypothetical protein
MRAICTISPPTKTALAPARRRRACLDAFAAVAGAIAAVLPAVFPVKTNRTPAP